MLPYGTLGRMKRLVLIDVRDGAEIPVGQKVERRIVELRWPEGTTRERTEWFRVDSVRRRLWLWADVTVTNAHGTHTMKWLPIRRDEWGRLVVLVPD